MKQGAGEKRQRGFLEFGWLQRTHQTKCNCRKSDKFCALRVGHSVTFAKKKNVTALNHKIFQIPYCEFIISHFEGEMIRHSRNHLKAESHGTR